MSKHVQCLSSQMFRKGVTMPEAINRTWVNVRELKEQSKKNEGQIEKRGTQEKKGGLLSVQD